MRPHAFHGSKERGREYGVGFFQLTWGVRRHCTRLQHRPGGQVDGIDERQRLQQPVGGADGSIRVLPQHRYGDGVAAMVTALPMKPKMQSVSTT